MIKGTFIFHQGVPYALDMGNVVIYAGTQINISTATGLDYQLNVIEVKSSSIVINRGQSMSDTVISKSDIIKMFNDYNVRVTNGVNSINISGHKLHEGRKLPTLLNTGNRHPDNFIFKIDERNSLVTLRSIVHPMDEHYEKQLTISDLVEIFEVNKNQYSQHNHPIAEGNEVIFNGIINRYRLKYIDNSREKYIFDNIESHLRVRPATRKIMSMDKFWKLYNDGEIRIFADSQSTELVQPEVPEQTDIWTLKQDQPIPSANSNWNRTWNTSWSI